eukprot:TRINITY_DN91910_c0_g1_i1.p1 TRINITY_DN91910_c0_g1~~TRINITY_DN91910_c0_g1_i1.p1  ORF type:complete len:538 (-),score=97.67 TRINITY_DN91910_c0_g1_i1:171-1784(-)
MSDRDAICDLTPGEDGWPAEKVFEDPSVGYHYDDIFLMPGHLSDEAKDVTLNGKISKNISLRIPMLSGPLSSPDAAISMALAGAIGVVHRNQSQAAQVEMLRRVKRFITGFVLDVVTLSHEDSVADVFRIKHERGFSSIPITENGKMGSKLVGIVSYRDIEDIEDRSIKLKDVMVTRIGSAKEPISIDEATEELRRLRLGRLPITDQDGNLTGLLTRADVHKRRLFPDASFDSSGQLMVGASVVADTEADWERAWACCEAGANVLILDTAVGDGDRQLEFVRTMKEKYENVEMIVGPVASSRAAKRFADTGCVDAIRVGSGTSLRATNGAITAPGRPEACAVYQVTRFLNLNYHYGIPTIAEGQLHNAGRMLKALCLGASALLLDDVLAGCEEAPSAPYLNAELPEPPAVKRVHHSCEPVQAIRALRPTAFAGENPQNRLGILKETVQAMHYGIELQAKGSVGPVVHLLADALKTGMRDMGRSTIPELHEALEEGHLRMECRCTFAAQMHERMKRNFEAAKRPHIMPIPPESLMPAA